MAFFLYSSVLYYLPVFFLVPALPFIIRPLLFCFNDSVFNLHQDPRCFVHIHNSIQCPSHSNVESCNYLLVLLMAFTILFHNSLILVLFSSYFFFICAFHKTRWGSSRFRRLAALLRSSTYHLSPLGICKCCFIFPEAPDFLNTLRVYF